MILPRIKPGKHRNSRPPRIRRDESSDGSQADSKPRPLKRAATESFVVIAVRAIERLNRFSDHGIESSVCERDEQPANYSADYAGVVQGNRQDRRWTENQKQEVADSVVRCQIEGIPAQRHADRESNDCGDERERDARHKIAILRE